MNGDNATDAELITAWVKFQREPAFQTLVARYAGLVHMAARRTCGDDSLAADAAQLTFILLARKAGSLTGHTSLAGWLHVTSVRTCRDLMDKSKRENRKRQQLAMENQSHPHGDAWQAIQPVLDDALASLSEMDREALLLRFYRSLSIREIAVTLGIATDAAQKRIDRATERLRGKLVRRGVQTSGSLSAIMLAGFTADAQATLHVSILASKAIAAGSASAIPATSIITLLATAMKSSSLIVPAVALISSAALIATQRHSIASLDGQTKILQSRITASDTAALLSSTTKPDRPTANPSTDESINWAEFVRKFEAMMKDGGGRTRSEDMGWVRLIENQLQAMSKEQLITELDRIATLDVAPPFNDLIKGMVMTPLIKKAPEQGLLKFMENPSADTDNWREPIEALKQWAMKTPTEATTWLDAQIAAGKLESKSLDGKNQLRLMLEKTLIGVLLNSDPDAASRRIGQLPENQRGDVLTGQPIEPKNQNEFAKMVRRQLTETDQVRVFCELAWLSVPKQGYGSASECLTRIEATSAERAACIEHVAISHFQQLARNAKPITSEQVDALREWTDSISPESTDLIIGRTLGRANSGGGRQTSFAKLGELAAQYSKTRGNDDILVEFLKEPTLYFFHKTEVRALTGKITDEKRRKEVLDYFDTTFPNP